MSFGFESDTETFSLLFVGYIGLSAIF